VEWLVLAAFGIMWAVFLLPSGRRRVSRAGGRSVAEFERGMDLLAQTEGRGQGRWIVTPQKGVPFLGPRERARARARGRRRRVLVFLLESIALTLLIGLVPPLRVAWGATALLGALLVAYVYLLLTIKARSVHGEPREHARAARAPARPVAATAAAAHRYVAEGMSRTPRPSFNGLNAVAGHDDVHVVVVSGREALQTVRA